MKDIQSGEDKPNAKRHIEITYSHFGWPDVGAECRLVRDSFADTLSMHSIPSHFAPTLCHTALHLSGKTSMTDEAAVRCLGCCRG